MCYAQYHEVVFSRLPEYGDDRASCGDSFCGESFPADFQSLGLDIQELLNIEFASGLTRIDGKCRYLSCLIAVGKDRRDFQGQGAVGTAA